jgi:hypothetical protein
MPDVFGDLAVNTRVHTTHYLAHEAAGAPGTRHSPRPLFEKGGEFWYSSGVARRENAKVCSVVIASAAKQSIVQQERKLDCFVAALLAMTLFEPCAQRSQSSSPAKAGDPVFQRRRLLTERRGVLDPPLSRRMTIMGWGHASAAPSSSRPMSRDDIERPATASGSASAPASSTTRRHRARSPKDRPSRGSSRTVSTACRIGRACRVPCRRG